METLKPPAAESKESRPLQEASYQEILFTNKSREALEEVIARDVPIIQGHDPQFFLRNQLSMTDVDDRLQDLYTTEETLQNARHSFKNNLHQIAYLLSEIKSPTVAEMDEAVRVLKSIFNGSYESEKIETTKAEHVLHIQAVTAENFGEAISQIPNVFEITEDHYDHLENYETISKLVSSALHFISEAEQRKVTMTILSASLGDVSVRAAKAKEVVEKYLNEARTVASNRELAIPAYYLPDNDLYNLIVKLRAVTAF